jgi:hypothetical protein
MEVGKGTNLALEADGRWLVTAGRSGDSPGHNWPAFERSLAIKQAGAVEGWGAWRIRMVKAEVAIL